MNAPTSGGGVAGRVSARPKTVWDVSRRTIAWQATVRGAIVVSALVALVAADRSADSTLPRFMLLLILALSVILALYPDSHVGLVIIGIVGYYWAVRANDRAGVWTLIGALAFTVFHSASALATVMPWRGAGNRAIVLRWLRRSTIVGVSATLAWGLSALMVAAEPSTNAVLSGVALVVVGFGIWALRPRRAPTD